jgi:RNA polymerase sigma-70 factor (ECF subfamily)
MQTVAATDSDSAGTFSARSRSRSNSRRLEELIVRVAARDQTALSSLYEETVGQLFAIAMAALRSKEDAEEVVCDVYQFVWDRAATYDSGRGGVMGWLTIATRNRAIDKFRQRRNVVSLDDERQEPLAASLIAQALGPDELLSMVEAGSVVHWALQSLSNERRYLLGLSFFQGLTHEQIAHAVNLPLGTVKSHLRRALATLQRHLTSGGYEQAL